MNLGRRKSAEETIPEITERGIFFLRFDTTPEGLVNS
jgi:hypothetical protein